MEMEKRVTELTVAGSFTYSRNILAIEHIFASHSNEALCRATGSFMLLIIDQGRLPDPK